MYRLALAIEDPVRLRAFEELVCSYDQSCPFDTVCAGPVEAVETYLDNGGGIDILVVETALGASAGEAGGIAFVERRFPAGCDAQVVYVAGDLAHAIDVYRTQHVYLLIDPVPQALFNDAIDRAIANLRATNNRPIGVRCEGRVQVVFPRKISYIESDRRKLHIHVDDEVLTTYATLDTLAEDLPGSFVRSHKSFLVNMRYIESMDSARIRLFTGEVLPVSQKRRKATHDAFLAYMDLGV